MKIRSNLQWALPCTIAIACSGTVAGNDGGGGAAPTSRDAGHAGGSGGHASSGGRTATGGANTSGADAGEKNEAGTSGPGGTTGHEIYDAGPIPSFCPARDAPPSASLGPGPGDLPDQLSVKFVLGTHLHLVDQELAIDESRAGVDSQFLRCTGLTLAGARAALVPINRLIDSDPSSSIAPLFVSSDDSVVTQYFLVNISATRAPELLSALRASPLVNVAYYSPAPAIPP